MLSLMMNKLINRDALMPKESLKTVVRLGGVCLVLLIMLGCRSGAKAHGPSMIMRWDQMSEEQQLRFMLRADREAILGMAGTFKVAFNFEETLALRDGYELQKPYHSEAEEMVVVIEDRTDFISLQHLLVLRHGGETQVIHHWRQDWQYQGDAALRYQSERTWKRGSVSDAARKGAWVQTVYNVDDSPRYTSVGRWRHGQGISTWTGSEADRPLPLRENHLSDQYTMLQSVNQHVVTDKGWLQLQQNKKLDANHRGKGSPILALEQGNNRYIRVPDEGFEKAHDYWKNTAPFWKEVRAVWAEVFEEHASITLAKRWTGEPMYAHLFDLSDEYWGKADAGEARPRIKAIIDAFVVETE